MRTLVVLLLSLISAAACGEAKFRQKAIPTLEVRAGQQVLAPEATVFARPDEPLRLEIRNAGTGALEIRGLTIESTPPGAFQIASLPMPSEAAPIIVEPDALGHAFAIEYHPDVVATGVRARAAVNIHTNLTLSGATSFDFEVLLETRFSRLVVTPPILDFAEVERDQQATRTANLLNTGAAEVTIARLAFTGHAGYRALIGGAELSPDGEITLASPLRIPPGSALKVDVTFSAQSDEPAPGRLVFYPDDAGDEGVALRLFANLVGPCIAAKPPRVAFGGKLVGQASELSLELLSCGDVELEISGLELVDNGGGVFAVDPRRVGTFPLTLPPAGTVIVPITYLPEVVAPILDGQLQLDRGRLLVRSDAYLGDLEVPLEGFGTDGTCPIADIAIAEGDEVIPQTVLHLDASGSVAMRGQIAKYEWSVVQPSGSVSVFAPSASVVDPTFEANIVGDYIFRLTVEDSTGMPSCAPAERTVTVLPADAIHVELLWRTPGDPDETDVGGDQVSWSAGSDLDLHFRHPRSFGIYFSPTYDCYWDNSHPEWGAPGPADNPRVDRDDTDGGGPENVNLEVPEDGIVYHVGVHYWNSWGYGRAFATVNVYLFGVLRDRWSDVELTHDDMWDVLTIEWPSKTITRFGDGAPKITPRYREIGPGD